MGIFTRVRDIMNSNINAALDKAEDPEKLVKQMIREMEDTLVGIKAACAGAMAGEKKAGREAESAQIEVRHWVSRSEMALDRGRDDLAREALVAKRQFEEEAGQARHDADQLGELVIEYKGDIVKIEQKLGTAQERQRVLVQRHIHAVQKKRAQRDIRRFDSSGAIVRFEEFAQRIDRADAEAELVNYGRAKPRSLEDEFVRMERDESIEKELKALKESRRSAPLEAVHA